MRTNFQRNLFAVLCAGVVSAACVPQIIRASEPTGATGVQLGRSTEISKDDPKGIYYESHLAVDPHNPLHMIAASSASLAGNDYTGFYATFDGGKTWRRAHTASNSVEEAAFMKGGDGAVFIGPSGTAFAIVGTRVHTIPKTLISRSTNGGRTWQKPVVLSYRDRPWMGFDGNEDGRTYGRIYAIGQDGAFILSISNDDGKTFTAGDVFVRDPSGPNAKYRWNPLPTNMLVTPAGDLVEPFTGPDPLHPYKPTAKINTGFIRMTVSEDGGRTFEPASFGPRTYTTGDGRAMSDANTAIDLSPGQNQGRVYVAYTNYESGRYVIRLAHTSDLGKTWGSSIVSDNTDGHIPDNPAVAVSGDGIVAVTWNDRRDDPTGQCWRLYGAISIDGGVHFLPNMRMSQGPTCTAALKNWSLSAWWEFDPPRPGSDHPLPEIGMSAFVPVRFPNGGDTQGLVADSNGVFHTAWINGEDGKLALWQTDFSVDPAILQKIRTANAGFRSGVTTPLPAGMIDESQELTFDVSHPNIDFTHHLISVTIRIINPTTHDVHGPIDVVLAHTILGSDRGMGLKNLRPSNTDNGQTADGMATWTFPVGPNSVLAAGQKTAARVLQFRFEGDPPPVPDGYFIPRFYIRAHS